MSRGLTRLRARASARPTFVNYDQVALVIAKTLVCTNRYRALKRRIKDKRRKNLNRTMDEKKHPECVRVVGAMNFTFVGALILLVKQDVVLLSESYGVLFVVPSPFHQPGAALLTLTERRQNKTVNLSRNCCRVI